MMELNVTSKRRLRIAVLLILSFILFMEISGFKDRLLESDFEDFKYPMFGNIAKLVDEMMEAREDFDPPFKHQQSFNFKLLDELKCQPLEGQEDTLIRLVYVVKSAMQNFDKRLAIRKTWGFEKRFSDVPVRTVFLLGISNDKNLEERIKREYENYGDIVQGDFIDSYYNNTLKSTMGLKWAFTYCKDARFYFYVDDDYYVSTRNVLRFLRNPINYPKYLQDPTINFEDVKEQNLAFKSRNLKEELVEFDLPGDAILYAGYTMFPRPWRHYGGKWSISLQDYPYNRYPKYVAAGAYVLSNAAMKRFYLATLFVKTFIFDDVYFGILAKKLNIDPLHSEEFKFYRPPYNVKAFRYVVASHDFGDAREMQRVWEQQKQAGNA